MIDSYLCEFIWRRRHKDDNYNRCGSETRLCDVTVESQYSKLKMKMQGGGAELIRNCKVWKVVACIYADDAVLFV